MEDVLSNLPLEILQGNRMVEVRHQVSYKANEGSNTIRGLVRDGGGGDWCVFTLCMHVNKKIGSVFPKLGWDIV